MAESPDLEITRFIVHVVNHDTEQLDLSDQVTPIGKDSGFPHEFFKDYIRSTLEDENRRIATFSKPGAGSVDKEFRAIVENPNNFIPASRAIAEHLYKVMSESRYKRLIHPGDIMLALYRRASEADGRSRLAIMKIDPSSVITREVIEEKGHRRVIFDESDSIPDPSENRIQKIALISPVQDPDPEPHEVVVLDNNLREKKVAHFFYHSFLESRLILTATQLTRILIDGLNRFLSRKADVVDPPLSGGEKLTLHERGADCLARNNQISPADFVDEVVELPDRPQEDVEALRKALLAQYQQPTQARYKLAPQRKVAIAQPVLVRKQERLTITMDGGVKLTGPTDSVRRVLTTRQKLDAAGRTVATIKSRIWRVS